MEMEKITLDVGGRLFVTTARTLSNVPDTRLSGLSISSAEYSKESNTYFFDRNPELFSWVLDLYRTGELHLPKNVCGAAIRNEMEFWQIGSGSISDCCISNLFNFEDELEVSNSLRLQFESSGNYYSNPCVKRPLKNGQNKDINDNWWFNEGHEYCRMLPLAILLTCIKR